MINLIKSMFNRNSTVGASQRTIRPRLSNELKNLIIADRNVRMLTYPQIAKKHKVSVAQVSYLVKQYNKRISHAS